MKREAMIALLAPLAPPCWESRSSWLSYLNSAADEQRVTRMPGPLLFTKGKVALDADAALKTADDKPICGPSIVIDGQVVTFDYTLGYCSDCEAAYRARMLKAGRCNPSHLVQIARKEIAS